MEREQVRALLDVCSALERTAERDRATWERVVNKVMPNLVDSAYNREINSKGRPQRVCTRAAVNVHKLASAHMSYIFPQGNKWFKLESWNASNEDDPDSEDWYAEMSDIMQREIERSNFYTGMYATVIDRCAPGTGALFIDMDEEQKRLHFTHVPAGTYAIDHDPNCVVDKLVRWFYYTPVQMADEFGEENLPERVKQMLAKPEQKFTEQIRIKHLVMPRQHVKKERYYSLPDERPYASYYISEEDVHLLAEDGYHEFPFMVTRFLRVGNAVYGESPLLVMEDTIDDLMVSDECLKLMGQRAALPSMAHPADMTGQIDLRAGGRTIIPIQYVNTPHAVREIAPVGNYPMAIDQKKMQEELLDDGMYIGGLQVFSNHDRNMTATEVTERSEEKLILFYPSFAQNREDFMTGIDRIFGLCFRAGLIPKGNLDEVPRELMQVMKDKDGRKGIYFQTPRIKYCGRMAQAMERVHSSAMQNVMAIAAQWAQLTQDPSPIMQIEVAKLFRYLLQISGIPQRFIKPMDKVEVEMEELQTARQQQQAAEVAELNSRTQMNRAKATNLALQYTQQ
jgi:hypothetical protein